MTLVDVGRCSTHQDLHARCTAPSWERVCSLSFVREYADSQISAQHQDLPQVVGGQPHGFGIWVEGKYIPVDIGGLAKLIVKMEDRIRELETMLEGARAALRYASSSNGD